MTNINNLYPHLQLYYEYMSNGDITNASNLLSHNDELNKYIQDKNDEHGYMTSNDVSNYITNEISNGKLLSSNKPSLSNHTSYDLGIGGYEVYSNMGETNPDLDYLVSQGILYDAIRNYLPTLWTTNLDMHAIYWDGLPLSYIEPYFDPNMILSGDMKEFYVKIGDFVLTNDNSLLLINQINNFLGLKVIDYTVISSNTLRADGGTVYRIEVSNDGQLFTSEVNSR